MLVVLQFQEQQRQSGDGASILHEVADLEFVALQVRVSGLHQLLGIRWDAACLNTMTWCLAISLALVSSSPWHALGRVLC